MFSLLSFPVWLVCSLGFIFVAFASLAEAFEFRERYIENDPLKDFYFSKLWHWFQLAERLFAILFGFSLAYTEYPYFILLFIASLFWIVYDGAINFSRNKNLFYISDYPVSPFDLFANKYLKLFFLLTSLFFLVW